MVRRGFSERSRFLIFRFICIIEGLQNARGVAQLGSVLRSGRRGRGFKSRHPDSGQGKHLDRVCFAREAG